MVEHAKETRPKTPDGTSDWENFFEDSENGLIPLIARANSAQALRDCAVVTIKMLFSRENNAEYVAKLTSELNKLVPDNAEDTQIELVRGAITTLLRQIKQDRVEAVQENVENKKPEEETANAPEFLETPSPNQTDPAPPETRVGSARPERRTARKSQNPTLTRPTKKQTSKKNKFANGLVWAVAAAIIMAIGLGSGAYLIFGGGGDDAAAEAWAKWIKISVATLLPNKSWKITSATKGDGKSVVIEILITDKSHIARIKSIRRMHRPVFLKPFCPADDIEINRMTEVGWSLWINLSSEAGKLTGGTCKY